jgi:hypothetical protein
MPSAGQHLEIHLGTATTQILGDRSHARQSDVAVRQAAGLPGCVACQADGWTSRAVAAWLELGPARCYGGTRLGRQP